MLCKPRQETKLMNAGSGGRDRAVLLPSDTSLAGGNTLYTARGGSIFQIQPIFILIKSFTSLFQIWTLELSIQKL